MSPVIAKSELRWRTRSEHDARYKAGTPVISVRKAKAHAHLTRDITMSMNGNMRPALYVPYKAHTHTHIPASFNSAQPVDLSRQLKFLATTKLYYNIVLGLSGELLEGKSVRV